MATKRTIRFELVGDAADVQRSFAKTGDSASALQRKLDSSSQSLQRHSNSSDKANHSVEQLAGGMRKLFDQTAKIGTIGLAAQGISALGAAGAATAASLGPLTGALAAYPALASAAGQGLGVIKLATAGVGKAVGGLNDQLDKNSKAYKQLTPQAQKFAQQVETLKKPLRDLSTTAQQGLFPGLDTGLKSATRNLPVLKGIVHDTAGTFGELAEQAGHLIGSKGFGRDLETQGNRNVTTLKRAGEVGLNLADALRHVTLAAGPLVDWITKSSVKLSELIDQQAKTGRESGRLGDFFHQTEIVMSRVARIGGDVAGALANIVKAAYPVGSDVLKAITLNANAFREWTDSAKGQNAIAGFFERARPAIDETGKLIVALVKAFGTLGTGDQVAPLLRTVRVDLLPAITSMVDKTTKDFMPAFLNLASQSIQLFTTLGGTSGPLVGFTKGLGTGLGYVNDITKHIPGIGTALAGLIAVGGISKALGLPSALSGVSTLSGALGRLGGTKTIGTTLSLFADRGDTPAKPLYVSVIGGIAEPGAGMPTAVATKGKPGAGVGGDLVRGVSTAVASTIVVAGATKGLSDAIQGGHSSDLGLLDQYAKSIERVSRAGDSAGMQKLAKQLRDTAAANADLTKGENLKRFADILDGMSRNGGKDLTDLTNAFDSLGKNTSSNIRGVSSDLDGLAKGSTSSLAAVRSQADQTAKRFQTMRDFTTGALEDINTATKDNMARIQEHLKSDSAAGKQALQDNFEQAIKQVKASLHDGVVSTQDALKDIRSYVTQELTLYGITFDKARKIADQGYEGDDAFRVAGRGDTSALTKKKAGGGWIGMQGMSGADSIPALLAPGEAVLNRHQQAVVEGLLGSGFLDRLFANVTTPHYLASGGRVMPGIAGGGAIGQVANAGVQLAGAAAKKFLDSVSVSGGSTTPSGGGGRGSNGQVRQWIAAGLRLAGQPATAANIALEYGLAMKESGGNPGIANTTDINAQRGDPSIGLMQTTGSTFRSYMVPGHGNIRNPVDNMAASARYQIARYGHLIGFSPYARGGRVGGALGAIRRRFAKGGQTIKDPFYWPSDNKYHSIPWATHLRDLGVPAKGLTQDESSQGQQALDAAPAAPTEQDFESRDLAYAQLTPDTGDDTAVYQRMLATARAKLGYDINTGNVQGQTQDLQDIKNLTDALNGLNDTITNQLVELNQEMVDNQRKILALADQGPAVVAAVVAAVNGGIGGNVGLGFATPGFAGGVASY